MQAVILAAGLGARLGDIKKGLPKGFLYIDELGESLIERSLRLLRESGIREVIIGTGYENQAYDELAKRLSDEHFTIMTKKNEDFATTGSAYTFECVSELITQDFLLLESDLLYEKRALSSILQDKRANIVLGSGKTYSGDEVYLSVKDSILQDLSKDKSKLSSIDGELSGISKLSFERLKEIDFCLEYDYEYLLRGFDCLIVPDLLWCEIDCAEHLERAKNIIIPQILRKDSNNEEQK